MWVSGSLSQTKPSAKDRVSNEALEVGFISILFVETDSFPKLSSHWLTRNLLLRLLFIVKIKLHCLLELTESRLQTESCVHAGLCHSQNQYWVSHDFGPMTCFRGHLPFHSFLEQFLPPRAGRVAYPMNRFCNSNSFS